MGKLCAWLLAARLAPCRTRGVALDGFRRPRAWASNFLCVAKESHQRPPPPIRPLPVPSFRANVGGTPRRHILLPAAAAIIPDGVPAVTSTLGGWRDQINFAIFSGNDGEF